MRPKSYLLLLVTGLQPFVCVVGQISQEVRVPKLGYVSAIGSGEVRPLSGIPGAALVGDRLELPFDIEELFTSPASGWAMAIVTGDRRPAVVRISSDSKLIPIKGAGATDRIVFSPKGVSAALIQRSGVVEVVHGLPDTPTIVRRFNTQIWNADIERLAISDDGLVLVALPDARLLWLSDTPHVIPLDEDATALAFATGGNDAIIATTSRLILMHGLELHLVGDSLPVSGIALSQDGRRVFVAYASGAAGWVDTGTGASTTVPCSCKPTGLYPLADQGLFRLNEFDGGPVFLLDTDKAQPRIWFAPLDRGDE